MLLQYLHDLAILAAVQCVKLIGFKVVWWGGCMRGDSTQFTLPPMKDFNGPGLSAAKWLRQKRLQQQQQFRLIVTPSLTSENNRALLGEAGAGDCPPLSTSSEQQCLKT